MTTKLQLFFFRWPSTWHHLPGETGQTPSPPKKAEGRNSWRFTTTRAPNFQGFFSKEQIRRYKRWLLGRWSASSLRGWSNLSSMRGWELTTNFSTGAFAAWERDGNSRAAEFPKNSRRNKWNNVSFFTSGSTRMDSLTNPEYLEVFWKKYHCLF